MVRDQVEDRDVIVFVRIPFAPKPHTGDPYGAVHANKQARDAYLAALRREMESSADLFEGRRVRAILVGGGIAAAASPDAVARLLIEFKRRVDIARGMELTVRFSPKTVGVAALSAFNACAFNRVGLAVLSTRDEALERIGTPHTMADLTTAIGYLGVFQVPNVDSELYYGIPGQTPTSLRNGAVVCSGGRGMTHISLTPYRGPGSENVSDDERRAQFEAARSYLASEGYRLYAAGRFARPGFECDFERSNALGVDRIGFGLGAHSFVDGMSYRNTDDFETYVAHAGDFTTCVRDVAEWDERDLAKRYVCGHMGLAEGIDLDEFARRFPACAAGQAATFEPVWERLRNAGLAEMQANRADGADGASDASGAEATTGTADRHFLVPTVEALRDEDAVRTLVWGW